MYLKINVKEMDHLFYHGYNDRINSGLVFMYDEYHNHPVNLHHKNQLRLLCCFLPQFLDQMNLFHLDNHGNRFVDWIAT